MTQQEKIDRQFRQFEQRARNELNRHTAAVAARRIDRETRRRENGTSSR